MNFDQWRRVISNPGSLHPGAQPSTRPASSGSTGATCAACARC